MWRDPVDYYSCLQVSYDTAISPHFQEKNPNDTHLALIVRKAFFEPTDPSLADALSSIALRLGGMKLHRALEYHNFKRSTKLVPR